MPCLLGLMGITALLEKLLSSNRKIGQNCNSQELRNVFNFAADNSSVTDTTATDSAAPDISGTDTTGTYMYHWHRFQHHIYHATTDTTTTDTTSTYTTGTDITATTDTKGRDLVSLLQGKRKLFTNFHNLFLFLSSLEFF